MTVHRPRAEDAVADELRSRLGDLFSAQQIQACVAAAAADLRGSIASESLPEMTTRLAVVRLTGLGIVEDGRSPGTGRVARRAPGGSRRVGRQGHRPG